MEIEVSDAEFEEKIIRQSGQKPMVVDFWAPWCAPCNFLSPILKKLAEEFEGKFVLAKVNVNDNREKAAEYGVMGIPAVKMFKEGKVVDEFVGAIPESQIREWLEKNI